MTFTTFSPQTMLAILPEILLVGLAALVMALDLFWPVSRRRAIGYITAGGFGLIAIVALLFSRNAPDNPLIFGGMIRDDGVAFFFRMMFIFSGMIVALLSVDSPGVGTKGEYYALVIGAVIGMNFMASAADLIMVYLAVETTSISLYLLAGFLRDDDKSAESGLKYFLFGAFTSTIMLYGFSLLFGFTGKTGLYDLSAALLSGNVPALPVLVRVLLAVFPDVQTYWGPLLGVVAVFTMTIGNTLALAQRNIKRLLAYSSIAQAGYALIGLAVLSQAGIASTIFYLLMYTVTNLITFGVIILASRAIGSDEIADYAGLSRRSPGLALAFLIGFLSLGGMPPFAGFFAKFFIFAAAVQSGLVWLAVIGVLNSIIGLYYYLTVLKVVYLYRSERDSEQIKVPPAYALALGICAVGVILIGTVATPWFTWASNAAKTLF